MPKKLIETSISMELSAWKRLPEFCAIADVTYSVVGFTEDQKCSFPNRKTAVVNNLLILILHKLNPIVSSLQPFVFLFPHFK